MGVKSNWNTASDTNKTVIVQDIVNGNNASIQSQFVQDRAVLIVPMSFFQWLLNDDTAIELTINTAQHEEVAECLADTGFFQVVDVAKYNGKFPPNIYASQNDGLHLHGFNDNDYWTKCMQYDFKYHRCP